ncbi:MAG: DUF5681 domain-containing protein [Alphaproteobacteria bacterium]
MPDIHNPKGSDNPEDPDKPYKVGYGRPPKGTRFKKGQSGNPKGRQRGSRNYSTDVKEALKTPVRITIDGTTKTMSRQRASIEMLVQKAFSGNDRLLMEFQRLAAMYNDDEDVSDAQKSLPNKDVDIIAQFLESRVSQGSANGGDDDPDN